MSKRTNASMMPDQPKEDITFEPFARPTWWQRIRHKFTNKPVKYLTGSGTEVITIPHKNDVPALFSKKDGIEKLVRQIEKQARAVVIDHSTAKGRKEVKSLAAKVSRSKTLIDDIRKDAEAGTPGPWRIGSHDPKRGIWVGGSNEGGGSGLPYLWFGHTINFPDDYEANAARIARVPEMEAALIAADALAEALEAAYSFIFDEYYEPNRDDGECLPNHARDTVDKITSAIAAYRKATGGDT